MHIVPIVMSGGAGNRLWPLTGPTNPKPHLRPGGGQTLLGHALKRAAQISTQGEVMIVADRRHLSSICAILHESTSASALHVHLVLEAEPCDTAAAMAAASCILHSLHGDSVITFVMPADQIVEGEAEFGATAGEAAASAAAGQATLIAIPPRSADMSFGYVEVEAGRVLAFTEKPQKELAGEMLRSGRHHWNSGMVCARLDTLVGLLETHCPRILAAARRVVETASVHHGPDMTVHRLSGPVKEEPAGGNQTPAPGRSFDRLVLEKADSLAVVEGGFALSDLGTWEAWIDTLPEDDRANRISGRVDARETRNCILHAGDRQLIVSGVHDIAVIDGPDVLFVGRREALGSLPGLACEFRGEMEVRETEMRPWGRFEVLAEGPGYKVKRLEIASGASTSLQAHRHRAEHWMIVSGTGRAHVDGADMILNENSTAMIACGVPHQLINDGPGPLVVIETQTGDILEENDEIRLDDPWGRPSPPAGA